MTETDVIEEAVDIPVEVGQTAVVEGVFVTLVEDDDTTGVDDVETDGEEPVTAVEEDGTLGEDETEANDDDLVTTVEADRTVGGEDKEADVDKLVTAVDDRDTAVVGKSKLHGTGMVTILPPDINNLEHRSWVTIERAEPGTTVTSPITLLATPSNVERIAPTIEPTSPALPGASPIMLDSLAGRSDSGILLGSGSLDSSWAMSVGSETGRLREGISRLMTGTWVMAIEAIVSTCSVSSATWDETMDSRLATAGTAAETSELNTCPREERIGSTDAKSLLSSGINGVISDSSGGISTAGIEVEGSSAVREWMIAGTAVISGRAVVGNGNGTGTGAGRGKGKGTGTGSGSGMGNAEPRRGTGFDPGTVGVSEILVKLGRGCKRDDNTLGIGRGPSPSASRAAGSGAVTVPFSVTIDMPKVKPRWKRRREKSVGRRTMASMVVPEDLTNAEPKEKKSTE